MIVFFIISFVYYMQRYQFLKFELEIRSKVKKFQQWQLHLAIVNVSNCQSMLVIKFLSVGQHTQQNEIDRCWSLKMNVKLKEKTRFMPDK